MGLQHLWLGRVLRHGAIQSALQSIHCQDIPELGLLHIMGIQYVRVLLITLDFVHTDARLHAVVFTLLFICKNNYVYSAILVVKK